MTLTLEQALDAAVAYSGEAVIRIDPDRKGGFHAKTEQDRWVGIQAEGCRELHPEEDRRLPLGAHLEALRARGTVTVLAYRPGRRLAVRLDTPPSRRVFKGYRKGRSAEAVRRHQLAEQALASTPVHAAPLQHHEPDLECMVLGWHEGLPPHLTPDGEGAFRRVGAALRAFQEETADLPVHDRQAELAVLDTLAGRVRSAQAPLPSGWEENRRHLEGLPVEGEVPLGLCHRDLHDLQLLLRDDGATLLDFDLLCLADPALDPANLGAHLSLRVLQGVRGATPEGALACARALREGLDREGDLGFGSRLRFYQGTTFLRLALVYLLRPPWTHLGDPLVQLARRCLDDPAPF